MPGVGLISPPPHHDIYSIEDLAEVGQRQVYFGVYMNCKVITRSTVSPYVLVLL